jgi:O-succinylbenzoate synthase
MLETGVGRASNLTLASLPNFLLPGDISSTDRYYRNDITCEEFVLNSDSTITIPDEPGLVITINHGEVKKVSLRSEVFKC